MSRGLKEERDWGGGCARHIMRLIGSWGRMFLNVGGGRSGGGRGGGMGVVIEECLYVGYGHVCHGVMDGDVHERV